MKAWIFLGALLCVSCSESPSDPAVDAPEPSPVATAEFGGLRQTVYLSGPLEPGRLLVFESRLKNVSGKAVPVRAWRRGLTFEGIALEDSEVFAAFDEVEVVLQPGHEILGGDLRRLADGQGVYEVRVHHSLDPEGAATFVVDFPAR